METKPQETEFVKHLHTEKLRTQEARTKYVLNKLAYATALLGLGSLGIEVTDLNLSWILYFVPLVALVFDFYIMGEDYSVKRIGAFLGANSSDPSEHRWEQWVSWNRDPLAPVAMPVLTTLLLAGSTAIILFVDKNVIQSPWFWAWVIVNQLFTWGFFVFFRSLRKRVARNIARAMGAPPPIKSLRQLITAVEKAGHQLDKATYRKAQRLFISCLSDPPHLQHIQKIAPEYGQLEFLRNVDPQGVPIETSEEILDEFHKTVARYPDFRLWFREAKPEGQTKPVLIIARWLCHLVGFRHKAIQLFIDHPHLTEHTLVQVRAVNKPESPGCFDIPVAGHVPDSASVEDTVFTELEEELNLTPDALEGFTQLGSYEYRQPHDQTTFRNIEHCVVFHSRLNAGAWPKLNATSPEVAAVATFALADLEKIIASFPGRIASGLKAAFPLYLKHKTQPAPKEERTTPPQ